MLDVADDGPGIPEADRARVFERFVRLDDARARDAGGSGLGLAIVAQLVAAHSGTVQIADDGTGGTRIEVRLPGATGGVNAAHVQPGLRRVRARCDLTNDTRGARP